MEIHFKDKQLKQELIISGTNSMLSQHILADWYVYDVDIYEESIIVYLKEKYAKSRDFKDLAGTRGIYLKRISSDSEL